MRPHPLVFPVCCLMLAGCSPTATPVETMAASAASAEPTGTAAADPSTSAGVSLVAVGFGQDGEYAAPVAIVKNNTSDVGQFVTVNFNLLDKSGEIITSEQQVEQITWPGQQLVLPTQAEVGKKKVAKVEATIDVSDPDDSGASKPQFTTGPVKVAKERYGGGWGGSFEVINPSGEKLTDLRIGVVCYNKGGDIIGGTAVYPELVPANGKVKAETTVLITSGKPTSCTAFPGGYDF